MGSETKFQNMVRKIIEKHGAKTEKLHGNMYQVGLPDTMILRPDGYIILIEFKWTRSYNLTKGELFKMLRPAQRGFFIRWRESPTYICVGSPRGCGLFLAEHMTSDYFDDQIKWDDVQETFENLMGVYSD